MLDTPAVGVERDRRDTEPRWRYWLGMEMTWSWHGGGMETTWRRHTFALDRRSVVRARSCCRVSASEARKGLGHQSRGTYRAKAEQKASRRRRRPCGRGVAHGHRADGCQRRLHGELGDRVPPSHEHLSDQHHTTRDRARGVYRLWSRPQWRHRRHVRASERKLQGRALTGDRAAALRSQDLPEQG